METVRQKMVRRREHGGITIQQMAKKCRISEGLMRMIEEGEVTHPVIAQRIARRYRLTELEAEELMPLNRRPHGGDYDPDRYAVLRRPMRDDHKNY